MGKNIMADNDAMTPMEIYEFFLSLDPGDFEVEGEEDIQYGSPRVLKAGLLAARMLLDVQRAVGMDPEAAPEVRPSAKIETVPQAGKPGPSSKRASFVEQALKEAEADVDKLLHQNIDLTKENESIKKRVNLLQRQVERLYTKNEMSTILDRIEGDPEAESDSKPEPESEQAAEASSVKDSGLETEKPADPNPDPVEQSASDTEPEAAAPESDQAAGEDSDTFEESELMDAARITEDDEQRKADHDQDTDSAQSDSESASVGEKSKED